MADLKVDIAEIDTELLEKPDLYRRRFRATSLPGSTNADWSGAIGNIFQTSGTTTNTNSTTGCWNRQTTGLAINNSAGLILNTYTYFRAGWDVEMDTVITIPGSTNHRATVGICNGSIDGRDYTTGAVPLPSFIGFQTSNPLAPSGNFQGNWICITSNGTTITRTPSVLAKPTSFSTASGATNRLRLRIRGQGTLVDFYIDNILVATHTTDINTSVTMGANVKIQNLNAVVTANYVEWSYMAFGHEG